MSETIETTDPRPDDHSSWGVGWAGFAGIMLILMGMFDIMQGLVALVDDDFHVVTSEWVFEFDVTVWGWIHLILGVVLVAAGIGIFYGNVLSRTIGVIVAAFGVLANFAWLPYYPIWSIVVIVIGVAIIWALTVHGRDITYL